MNKEELWHQSGLSCALQIKKSQSSDCSQQKFPTWHVGLAFDEHPAQAALHSFLVGRPVVLVEGHLHCHDAMMSMKDYDYDADDDELDDDNVQKCSALGPHQVWKWLSTSSVLFRTTHFSSLGDWVHLEVGIVIDDKKTRLQNYLTIPT